MTINARNRYERGPQIAGPGYSEEQLHPATGLRIASFGIRSTAGYSHIAVGTIPIGTETGDDVLDWTSLRYDSENNAGSWSPRSLIVPMTPTVFIGCVSSNAAIRFRCTGYDQFLQPQTETGPWVELTTGLANNQHWYNLSKVFSFVEDVEYQSRGFTSLVDNCAVGFHVQLDSYYLENVQLTDAGLFNTNIQTYGTLENWGIGTPLRIGRHQGDFPYPDFEVIASEGINISDNYSRSAIPRYDPTRANTTGFTIGRSLPGWEGTPHKIGIHSDDWQNDKLGVDLTGSATHPDTTAPFAISLGDIGADSVELHFTIRTRLGTGRPSASGSSYVWG